jgi:hypothetical protein
MKGWTWNTPSYWTDIETIQKVATKSKQDVILSVADVYDHESTDFNYSFIEDAAEASDNNLQGELVDLTLSHVGSSLISVGFTLLIPEGSELVFPWTWADEVVGITLIGSGVLLKVVDWS